MKNTFILLVLFAVLSPLKAQQMTRTENHYYYLNHTNRTDTERIAPGESVMVKAETWVGDSLLVTSRNQGNGTIRYDFPAQKTGNVTPLYEAVSRMRIGDSVSILHTMDSATLLRIPGSLRKYRSMKHIFVAVSKVVTAAEQQLPAETRTITLDEAAVQKIEEVDALVQQKIKEYNVQSKAASGAAERLDIVVVEKGTGEPLRKGERITLHYHGSLRDGKKFDSSWDIDEPLTVEVGVGKLVPGFDYGLLQLRHKSRALLFVPASMGYGTKGLADYGIGPNARLVFYVEVF
jgi:FKBP-type peptidyl-prolyl cis-trans isomerase